jgi:hypothetical protein
MRELAQFDNTEKLNFREADFWADAAAEFNQLRAKYLEYKKFYDENRGAEFSAKESTQRGATC